MGEEKAEATTLSDTNLVLDPGPGLPPLPRLTIEPYYKNRPQNNEVEERRRYEEERRRYEYTGYYEGPKIPNFGPSLKTALGLWGGLGYIIFEYNLNFILFIIASIVCFIVFIALLVFGEA